MSDAAFIIIIWKQFTCRDARTAVGVCLVADHLVE